MLQGKKVLVGVCGSIAAYKSALLVRLLVKAGAQVRVIMTEAATGFISPLTLSTLSKNEVLSTYSDEKGNWNDHVELGLWADVMVVAPATANTLAKFANGLCNNLLSAVYLSAKCPVAIAPAMDLDMWKHPSTTGNLNKLTSYSNHLIPVGDGELASGLEGKGRMAEPEDIIAFLEQLFKESKPNFYTGKKVMITAGPTMEAIDPVRFISNHSSGKMGIALAEELSKKGAIVTLVLGPTSVKPQDARIKVVHVQSAEQMYEAGIAEYPNTDLAILAAAVSDFTPVDPANEKIKKNGSGMVLELKKTKDILSELGLQKKVNQLLVGFALETSNALENAQGKLTKKKADLIVMNSLKDSGAGFGYDTNKVTILDNKGNTTEFQLKSKQMVALDIINTIEQYATS